MKIRKITLILPCLFLLATSFCNAQQKFIERTIDYQREIYESKGLAVTALNANNWVIVNGNDPYCFYDFLSAFGENNNTKWINNISNLGSWGSAQIFDIISTRSGNAVVSVGMYGNGGDVLVNPGNFIAKLDSNGNQIWKREYDYDTFPIFGKYSRAFKGVTEAPDGSIYAFAWNKAIAKVDTDGKRIWEKTIVTDSIFAIAATADNGLMLATNAGISKMDENGKLLWSKSLPQGIKKIILINSGNYVALAPQTIYKFDSSGAVISTSAINKDFGFMYKNFTTIAANDDAFFIASDLIAKKTDKVILSIDQATFDVNWTYTLTENINIAAIAVKDSLLAITGRESSQEDQYLKIKNAHSFIKTISIYGNTAQPMMDAGIIRIIPGTIRLQKVNTGDPSMKIYNVGLPLSVVIKNFGTTVLDSVSAFSQSDYHLNCYTPTVYTHFTNLSLQPGDSVTLPFGEVWSMNKFVDKSVKLDFCVNTLSPNGRLDYNVANDMLCDSITQIVTGIDEQEQHQQLEIKVYPNPANELVIIESAEPVSGNISVINTLGQEINTVKMKGEKILKLQLNEIPEGVYFIKISNGNMNTFKSFVKSK